MNQSVENQDTQAIVFFDGVCGLCNHAVNFLMNRDSQGVLRFAPLQGHTASEHVPEEIRQNLNTFVFHLHGTLHYRSGAMARILMHIGGMWRIIGFLMWLVPWPVRDLVYRAVSVVRYRVFGKNDACRLPTPDERSRFLE